MLDRTVEPEILSNPSKSFGRPDDADATTDASVDGGRRDGAEWKW